MATTKKTETKAVAVKETAKAAPAAEVKAAAPAVETKAPAVEVKEAVKEAAAPKKEAAAPKKEAAAPKKEAAAPKKAAPKKTAAPKKAAPKTEAVKKAPEKKEVKANVYVQYLGKEISAEKLVDEAKKAYVAAGHKEADIKTVDVYVKPEENAAYYAVNGEGSVEFKITL